MSRDGLRSAVIVPVAEVAGAVDGWRERTCLAKPSAGVPPHITLVFPFAPAAALDDRVVASLGRLFEGVEPFPFELRELRRFALTLYIAPEPELPFVRLTEAIVERFPHYPPYEGAFESIVPHLTVAEGEESVLGAAAAEVRHRLPIRAEAREAVLLEEVESDWGYWEVHARLRFGTSKGPEATLGR